MKVHASVWVLDENHQMVLIKDGRVFLSNEFTDAFETNWEAIWLSCFRLGTDYGDPWSLAEVPKLTCEKDLKGMN